jgi:pimeloyl-ACP methyl ester carboxylesterase
MSAGGHGALMYALKHPELFGTVTAVAGAFFGSRVNAWPEMYNFSEENYRPYDCFALLTPALAPKLGGLRFAFWIGSADITIGDNTAMRRLLQARGVAHTYNDATTHPKLDGLTHDFRQYYALYGKEILRFHAQGWAAEKAEARKK